MADESPTLAQMTGIQLEGLLKSQDIGRKIWLSRNRIRDAYLRDQRYDSIGKCLTYCPWNVCMMDETTTHAHLHRAGSTCEWTGCDKKEVHLHKFKPPPSDSPEDVDPTGRYERVKDIMKEILGEQCQEEPLAKNIYVKLEEERRAEEAEKERETTRLADAERARDDAKREFEQATAERRAQRADDRKKAREVDQNSELQKLERKAARAQFLLEVDTGNELEETSTYANISSGPSQIVANDTVVGGAASSGKRKRDNSPLSQVSSSPSSSPTDSYTAKAEKLADEEASPNTGNASTKSSKLEVDSDSETSDLTLYTPEQLDAILNGAEIVRHEPNSLPIHTQEVPELAPDIVFDQEPVSNDSDTPVATGFSVGHSRTSITSADEEIQPPNGSFLGSMPPLPSPPRQTEPSEEEAEIEEQLARRRQIQWVLKNPKYKKSERKKWAAIKIYEDPEESSTDEIIAS